MRPILSSSIASLTENNFLEELRSSLFERAEDEKHGRCDDDRFATPDIGYASGDEAADQGSVECRDDDARLLAERELSSAEGSPDGKESTRGDSGIVAAAGEGPNGPASALYRLYWCHVGE